MTVIISIIAIILAVFFLVGFHEYGHLIAARWCGVKAKKFSIGFGKALYSWRNKYGTEFVWAAIPLGGYVKLLDDREGDVSKEDLPYSFTYQPIWQRVLIIFAGPLCNFLLAFVAFWLTAWIGYSAVHPTIERILPDTPAAQAQMQAGHRITGIDDWQATDWTEVLIPMVLRIGDSGTMTVKTTFKGKNYSYDVGLANWKMDPLRPDPLRGLGFEPQIAESMDSPLVYRKDFTFIESFNVACVQVYKFTWLNMVMLGKILIGKISLQSLAGPLSLFQGAINSLESGIVAFIGFIGFVSIAVGFVNLLPIPGLDGSHLIYLVIEKFTGKPISVDVQVLAYRLGIIFFAVVLFNVLMNDLLRLLT